MPGYARRCSKIQEKEEDSMGETSGEDIVVASGWLLLLLVIVGAYHKVAWMDRSLVGPRMLAPPENLINSFAKQVLWLSRRMPRGSEMTKASWPSSKVGC